MRWPWVSRHAMAAWQARAERAEAQFDALWQQFTKSKEPKATITQPLRTPEQAVQVVEDGFVSRLKAQLEAQGVPAPFAEAEARRIRKETQPQ